MYIGFPDLKVPIVYMMLAVPMGGGWYFAIVHPRLDYFGNGVSFIIAAIMSIITIVCCALMASPQFLD
jgi:hypothetical protein